MKRLYSIKRTPQGVESTVTYINDGDPAATILMETMDGQHVLHRSFIKPGEVEEYKQRAELSTDGVLYCNEAPTEQALEPGENPAELAHSILTEYFGGDRTKADPYYQAFKFRFVALIHPRGGQISEAQIETFIRESNLPIVQGLKSGELSAETVEAYEKTMQRLPEKGVEG